MIIGNEKQKKFLKELLDDLSQATILLYGPEGVGKFSLIKEFLKEKNWESIFFQTPGENFKIETARKIVSLGSYKAEKRVMVIDAAHKFHPQAQNTLLKTLEEAPSRTIFVFITHQFNKILPTIRSRSILIKFNLVDKEKIYEFLKTKGYQEEEIEIAYKFYPGQPGKILKFLEDKNKFILFQKFVLAETEEKLSLIEELKNHFTLTEFLEYYLLWQRRNLSSQNIFSIKNLLNLYGESESNLNFDIQIANLVLTNG